MYALQRQEAAKVVGLVLDNLAKTVAQIGPTGSDLRRAIGDLRADAEALIGAAAIAQPLADVFDLARQAGATFDGMDRVRRAADAIETKWFAATSVKNTAVRFALIQSAKILAATAFKSRPEIDRYIDRMNVAFESAEIVASDSLDHAAYRSIIALHAAVTNDLTTRGRPLPNIVLYEFAAVRPALYLANRLYGDTTRADDLINENKPVHPAFMSPSVRALSR